MAIVVVLPRVLAKTIPSIELWKTQVYLTDTEKELTDRLLQPLIKFHSIFPYLWRHPELTDIRCDRGITIDEYLSLRALLFYQRDYHSEVDALDRILNTINPSFNFRGFVKQSFGTKEVLQQDNKPKEELGKPSYTNPRGQVAGTPYSSRIVVACLGVAPIAITLAFGVFLI